MEKTAWQVFVEIAVVVAHHNKQGEDEPHRRDIDDGRNRSSLQKVQGLWDDNSTKDGRVDGEHRALQEVCPREGVAEETRTTIYCLQWLCVALHRRCSGVPTKGRTLRKKDL